jgi:hypothetical protein
MAFLPGDKDITRESNLCQEMGPKKFHQMVEKENKFYDQHKAGRKDPKTGQMYYNIDYKDPRKQTIKQKTIDGFMCDVCESGISLSRTTFMIQCSHCQTLYKITRDKLTDEFEVDLIKNGRE